MRAVLLGTGSPPPNPQRRGPATLLALGDERFLVDAGSGVRAQLVQGGVPPRAGTKRRVDSPLAFWSWHIEAPRSHMRGRRPPDVRVTEIEEGKILDTG